MRTGEGRLGLARTALVCALFVTGIVGSLKVVFASFGIEPDTSHSLMLWFGVREHGLGWLTDWLFTQDNWLFSLMPFYFAGFALFGPGVKVVVVGGWLIYLASAAVSYRLVQRAGAGRFALVAAVILINLGLYAHVEGFVSYSTSHNVTNLCGLLSLLVVMRWVVAPRFALLVPLALLVLAGTISDPWMLAAYDLPLLLVALVPLVRERTTPLASRIALPATMAAAIVVANTKVFGLLGFLPSVEFKLADWATMNANAVFLVRTLGGLFGLVPFARAADFIPASISLSVVASVVVALAIDGWRHRAYFGGPAAILFGTTFLSTGALVTALVVSRVPASDQSARFLIDVFYLVTIASIVVAAQAWPRLDRTVRAGLIGLVTLFVFANLASIAPRATVRDFHLKSTGVERSVRFYRDNGLAYGYGPYWGAYANAVTAASGGKIRLRPVEFDTQGRMLLASRLESSKRWYRDEDIPAGVRDFFVYIKSDGETCPDLKVCLTGLERQFGPPLRSLAHDGGYALVWDHKLVVDGAIAPLAIGLDRTVRFDDTGPFANGAGWSRAEPWGTWSRAAVATLDVRLVDYNGGAVALEVDCGAYLTGASNEQSVAVVVNGEPLARFTFDAASNRALRTVELPEALVKAANGTLAIEFRIAQPVSPATLGQSGDDRALGLSLVSIAFRQVR